MSDSATSHPDPLARRYRWNFWARWWDCVAESLDMEASRGALPGMLAEHWSYLDLYETEDQCIATTPAEAEAHFTALYPWIPVYHITLLGEHIPAPKSRTRPKKAVTRVR